MRRRVAVLSKYVAILVAQALIKRYPEMLSDHIDLKIHQKLAVKIPESLCEEKGVSYLHGIVRLIKENDIATSLVKNLDQNPTKLALGINKTIALKGSKFIIILGQLIKAV